VIETEIGALCRACGWRGDAMQGSKLFPEKPPGAASNHKRFAGARILLCPRPSANKAAKNGYWAPPGESIPARALAVHQGWCRLW